MLRIILLCFAVILSINAEVLLKVPESGETQGNEMPLANADVTELDIESTIEKIESIATAAEKSYTTGIVPIEDIEQLYDDMVELLDDVIEYVKHENNAYKFLKAKGIDRIVAPNIVIAYNELRKDMLVLMNILFQVAPTTTNAVIPINIVDGFLDIFENDDNLALKAYALDILSKWLPNNPKVQTRVMKVKGLEPFYKQITKLDVSVIQTLLDLFNKILREHLNARDTTNQSSEIDAEKSFLYKRIGLLERMPTRTVCNGLYNIFEVMWSYTNNATNASISVIELMRSVKPFCLNVFKTKTNAVGLFDAVLKYVKDEGNLEYFTEHNVDVNNVQTLMEEYIANLKHVRDEF